MIKKNLGGRWLGDPDEYGVYTLIIVFMWLPVLSIELLDAAQ